MGKVITNDFVVRCAPEQAFELLSDLRNELEWNPGECQSVEKITDGPVGRGTKYRAKRKGGPEVEVEYVDFERPRRILDKHAKTGAEKMRRTLEARYADARAAE